MSSKFATYIAGPKARAFDQVLGKVTSNLYTTYHTEILIECDFILMKN